MNEGTRPKLTASGLEATVASLAGRRIAKVTYFGLGDEEPVDWDFGDWHDVVMAVELTLDDGTVYTASWDNSFTEYGLEMVAASAGHYVVLGDLSSVRRWEVTGHPRWRSLLADPVSDARVHWNPDPEWRFPLAVRLAFPAGEVWIIAGTLATWLPDETFRLGTDDVIVGFTDDFAARVGLI